MSRLNAAAAVAVLLLAPGPRLHAQDDAINRAMQRVVAVTSYLGVGPERQGGGVWVGHDHTGAYIAVPFHVVRSGATAPSNVRVEFWFSEGQTFPATVLDSMDVAMDLAVLLVEGVELPPIPSNAADPRAADLGEATHIIAHSLAGSGWDLLAGGGVSSRDGLFIEVWNSGFAEPPKPFAPRGRSFRFNRAAGIAMAADPHDPTILYAGSQGVHRSTDRGETWTEISPDLTRGRGAILTIAPSPVQPRVIWVGSDDGLIHITRNGGRVWTRVTPPRRGSSQVLHIEASQSEAGTAFAVFRDPSPTNRITSVLETRHYGASWAESAPDELDRSVEAVGVVGGGLFNSDSQLIGMIMSRNELKTTALRIDVILEKLRSWNYPAAPLSEAVAAIPPVRAPPHVTFPPTRVTGFGAWPLGPRVAVGGVVGAALGGLVAVLYYLITCPPVEGSPCGSQSLLPLKIGVGSGFALGVLVAAVWPDHESGDRQPRATVNIVPQRDRRFTLGLSVRF